MGKGSPAQPHFPRIFAFYDTSSAGSLQGGKNECRFAEVSNGALKVVSATKIRILVLRGAPKMTSVVMCDKIRICLSLHEDS